jgi:hypothetical protein
MLAQWTAKRTQKRKLLALSLVVSTLYGAARAAPYYPGPRRFEIANTLQKVFTATDAADPDAWIGYIYDGTDAASAPSWVGMYDCTVKMTSPRQ